MPGWMKRAMVYLGLADDEDYADYSDYDEQDSKASHAAPHSAAGPPQGSSHAPYAAQGQDHTQGSAVRMLPREDSGFKAPSSETTYQSSAVRTIPTQPPSQKLHLVNPFDFNDGAKEIGDRFKAQAPVIMNLAATEKPVAKRLLDFASGLTYGLGGRMNKVGQDVFLLTPSGVEVSAEDKRRLRETGIFFDELER